MTSGMTIPINGNMKVYRNIFIVGKKKRFRGSDNLLAYNGRIIEECDNATLTREGFDSGVDYVITCECEFDHYSGLLRVTE